jgi:hypothetical protein
MKRLTTPAAILSLAIAAVLIAAATGFAQRGTSIVQRVHFPRGGTQTTLRGTVHRGMSHDYILGARAGQTMTVHLATSRGVSFAILTPDGEPLVDGARDWSGELPLNGEYRINVLPDTSTNVSIRYALEINIR